MRRKRHAPEQIIATLATTLAFVLADPAGAQELGGAPDDAAAASDPTARVNFMDFRWRYFDLPGGNLRRVYGMEGATMLTPNFKFVPKLEYFDTNAAGRS